MVSSNAHGARFAHAGQMFFCNVHSLAANVDSLLLNVDSLLFNVGTE